jgi:hypothetical protein
MHKAHQSTVSSCKLRAPKRYERKKSDDIGGLLGAMSMLDDGSPADPAMVADWEEAVQFALKGGGAASLKLR